MLRIIFAILVVFSGVLAGMLAYQSFHTPPTSAPTVYPEPELSLWEFQAVDTMKYSRDVAREYLRDPSFDRTIDAQMKAIAATGATHVGIATPYDEEFLPFLRRWESSARYHGLKVWYRGNWSGWEGWFEYPEFDSFDTHIGKTRDFILKHPDLFRDGDAFTGCPECENGGPGDPRRIGNVKEYRRFLVREYEESRAAFRKIGRDVRVNYFSMNGDVARLVMDQETTRALGGIVTIDHYVKTPEQLARDVEEIAEKSGGRVVLGEFGAPIPDIHGSMSQEEQARWIDEALRLLSDSDSLAGASYWLSVGGSTAIMSSDGEPREAVKSLARYFKPRVLYGTVHDERGRPLPGAQVRVVTKKASARADGYFELAFVGDEARAIVSASGYRDKVTDIPTDGGQIDIVMEHLPESWWERLLREWRER